MKIAILGPKGTFSDLAGINYLSQIKEKGDLFYFSTIEETVKSLQYDTIDLAIVPLENTLDGYVQLTLDLLLEESVKIIDDISIPIHFKLMGNITSLNDIKSLYVQFKTQGQCKKIIRSLNKGISIITTESNMHSFNYLLNGADGDASIVPLHIEDERIPFTLNEVADINDNYTRFIVLTKKDIYSNNHDKAKFKVSLYITPKEDKPGLLFSILKSFAEYQINLTSIMSRPTKRKIGSYNFYLEFDCLKEEKNQVIEILDKLSLILPLKVLGIY